MQQLMQPTFRLQALTRLLSSCVSLRVSPCRCLTRTTRLDCRCCHRHSSCLGLPSTMDSCQASCLATSSKTLCSTSSSSRRSRALRVLRLRVVVWVLVGHWLASVRRCRTLHCSGLVTSSVRICWQDSSWLARHCPSVSCSPRSCLIVLVLVNRRRLLRLVNSRHWVRRLRI